MTVTLSEPIAVLSSVMGRPADADAAIEAAASAKLGGVEWALGPGQALERDTTAGAARHLLAACEKADLRIGGICVQDPKVCFSRPESVIRALELAASIKAPHVRMFAPRLDDDWTVACWERLSRSIAKCAQVAARLGRMLLVEPSPQTAAPSCELARFVVRYSPPLAVGVVYDPASLRIEGGLSPRLATTVLGSYLRSVHVKNIAWYRQRGDWRWKYEPLESGLVDWRDVLEALSAAAYRGWYTIDHLSGEPTYDCLARDVEALRALMHRDRLRGVGDGDDLSRRASGDQP